MRVNPIILIPLALIVLVAISRYSPISISEDDLEIKIPKQSDWVDYGTIVEPGEEGEWDYLLWGGLAATAVEKDGVYYLYYQGAEEYLGAPHDTVVWRSIGVATSVDGINFTKYDGNPVLTWFPSGYPDGVGEEGAASGGATLDENGNIILYYGANTAESPTTVTADGRIAISENGFDFEDAGIVLDHNDKTIWGSGDELFPIAVLSESNTWVVYYLPNGRGIGRNLGVAWGDGKNRMSQSAIVTSGFSAVSAWGIAGSARAGDNIYAIFTNWATDPRVEVRLMSLDAPDKLTRSIRTYEFDDVSQAIIMLDEDARTWFMYYRNEDYSAYGVKLAPVEVLE